MGQVENVSVETDPAFDRALKAAVQRGGSDPDAVLNALVEELEITAPLRFSISGLGSGSAGQQGLDVVFQSGTNPNAAANNAATAWLPILRGLEGNGGAYSARASLVEVNGGYILAIGVKVEQPGDGGDEPDPVTLKSIAVSTNPTKTEYWVNETFDPTGMEITATYSNNTTKTITGITETDKKGVSWTPDGALSTSDTSITISYGGKTATVAVTVKEPEVQRIEVTTQPKTTYTAGEYFNPAGMVVTAYYSDNIKTETISSGYTITDQDDTTVDTSYQFTTAGTYTLTVSYQGKEDTIEITVNPATLDDITVTWPNKTYSVGETLDKSDITVTASYSNGSTSNVSNYVLAIKDPNGQTDTITSPYTFTTEGEYTLRVTYENQTQTTTITVENNGYTYDENSKTYSVYNADGLKYVADLVNSGDTDINITLPENGTIDLSNINNWTPIGTYTKRYNGTFDGNNCTITGLTINSSTSDYQGFFGCIDSGGKVQDLKLTNVSITGRYYSGAVVGMNSIGGTIENCTVVLGSVTGSYGVGGVAGYNGGTLTACSSAAWVKSTGTQNGWAGGVVGINAPPSGTLIACYATGEVTAQTGAAGGVVGYNAQGTLIACYATGNVTGTTKVGGVVGSGNKDVTACYWSGTVKVGTEEKDQGMGGTGSGTIKVDGTNVKWEDTVAQMNAALQSAGSEWQYELTGALPTLKK